MVVKTISGSTAVSAAAAIGLVGTRLSRKSAKVGEGGASAAPPSPWRSAAAAPAESGKRRSSSGVSNSDMIPVMTNAPTKIATLRAASATARAPSAVAVMPVTRNATISGMIVHLTASSHDRKNHGQGKGVSVLVTLGGRRRI